MSATETPRPDAPAAAVDKRGRLARALREKASRQVRVWPLSPGQKALWFLHRRCPESPAYHVAFSARIRSAPDVDALRRSFQALVDRHPLLRATFKTRDGEVMQEVAGYRDVAFSLDDCTGFTEEELRERVAAAYRRPFDLENGPPFRVELFRRAPDDHVLLITVHHIVYDAWSLWMNLDELRRLYAAETSGSRIRLFPVGSTYEAYVQQQAEALAGPEGERLFTFWKGELAGAAPTHNLPTDRPRPAVQTYNGASRTFELGADLAGRIRALAQTEGVTPFILLMAAFQVFLHRYSGEEQIVVGTVAAGRTNDRYRDVVGYFVNPVVVKADLSGNPVFRSFLQDVRGAVLRALEHQDYPFPVLVERLQPARDPSHAPLFQVSFVMQKVQRIEGADSLIRWSDERGPRYDLGGLELEDYALPQQEGQTDLELGVIETGGAFLSTWRYNTDLFDAGTIERMARHFVRLLDGIADDPRQSVSQLPLLDDEERARMLSLGRAVEARGGAADCTHRLFERQVEKTPDATALVHEGSALTYRELNERANRLAHHLQTLGVGRESLVGLCLERSLEMVIGILGILKAGGAYLPLDPASPKDRLSFIMADSGVRVLVTQESLASAFPEAGARVVRLDADWPGLSKESQANPTSDVRLEDLAYVIYTSGSTGKPKGVQVTHRNVVRLLTATEHWYGFNQTDVWTLFHSVAFDWSVWEIWGALLYGGRLVVVPHLTSRSPGELLELLVREKVTVLSQTPSAFRMLMEADTRTVHVTPLALRVVIFGGEALDIQSLKPWLDRRGDVAPRLVNMYGITETTVVSTYRPIRRDDLASSRSVIGVPIPDVQIYLLDRYLQPVPVGVTGEVYVGGAGVARGYVNRPELTEERFIADPFSDTPGARLYKSGDLARFLADGEVEYLGRIDNQVKIRGFRVELGEIEAALGEHPDVEKAVVTVRGDQGGDKRIVAYVIGRPEQPPRSAVLRQFLTERLPGYMVPAVFLSLGDLPLTNNGKIDYGALPSPDTVRSGADGALVPPRDEVERKLVRLWEKVLGVRPIGVQDNFFDLGGHSVLAVHLMAAIEQAFDHRLPLATLFQNPTVERLGELLRTQTSSGSPSPLVLIQPAGSERPFFCVAGGGGSVLYFYELAHRLGQERPFYGLQAIGLDGECEPLDRVESIAARHIEALRPVQPHGPYLLGGHCFGGLVAFEMAQQLTRQGEEVQLVALLDVPAPHPSRTTPPGGGESDVPWLVTLGAALSEGAGRDLGITPEALGALDGEGRLGLFRDRMQAAGLLPPGGGLSQVRGLLRVFGTNSRIRYEPDDVRPVPLALFRAGERHPDYDFGAADDPGVSPERSTMGWSRLVGRHVQVHLVPGNHITMMSSGPVAALAESLALQLRNADTDKGAVSD
jgi:amino acid adenylation domain-containing protein